MYRSRNINVRAEALHSEADGYDGVERVKWVDESHVTNAHDVTLELPLSARKADTVSLSRLCSESVGVDARGRKEAGDTWTRGITREHLAPKRSHSISRYSRHSLMSREYPIESFFAKKLKSSVQTAYDR